MARRVANPRSKAEELWKSGLDLANSMATHRARRLFTCYPVVGKGDLLQSAYQGLWVAALYYREKPGEGQRYAGC